MRVFSCVLIVALAIAEPAGAETLRAGPSVKIEGGSDNVFAAGADVEISGDVASTSGKRAMVAAAGGSVTVSADVDGDVAIAGGDVSFSGRTDHLFAAGGNVAVSGRADDRAAIAGGRITVEPTAIFANDVKIAGASVDFGGQAQKGAKLAGGFVRLAGAVEGDAELAGESIEVGPQAHVSGDLVIEAPDKPDIPSSAVIGGEVIYKKTSVHDIEWKRWDHHPFGSPHSVREGIFGALFGFVVLSASGIVMMLLFPNWLGAAAAAGRDKPLTSLLIGFAALIVLPITAIIFMLIALGIPFGAFLLSVYVGLLCISMIGAGLAVGHLLLDRSKSNEAKIVFFLLGLALLLLVGAAPVVGPVVGFLAVMLGLGVLIRALWSMIAGRPAAA